MRGALLALLVPLAMPAPAVASLVELRTTSISSTLHFQAAPGEANVLEVEFADGAFLVRDSGGRLQVGAGCTPIEDGAARCPGSAVLTHLQADLGDGHDRAAVTARSTRVFAGAGDDVVRGGTGDDDLNGGGGRDQLHGGAGGADRLADGDAAAGAFDADELAGGVEVSPVGGGDVADYSDRRTAVTVDLAAGRGPDGDRLEGFDQATGGSAGDVLRGFALPNLLRGGSGADLLDGGGHSDVLAGEAGADRLLGGEGDDQLAGDAGADLLDAGAGDDRLAPGPFGDGRDTLRCGDGRDVVVLVRFEDPVPRACERLGGRDALLTVPARLGVRGGVLRVHVEGPGEEMDVRGVLRTRRGRRLARTRTVHVTRRAGSGTLRLRLPRRARPRRAHLDVRAAIHYRGATRPRVRRDRFYVRVG